MKKDTSNYKLCFRKRAFTLIELLIVIAIIGILFIVLVSKVDFATDKAKISGVQTDFRSFSNALEMVAKENAGFNTFGWDIGDIKRADFAMMFPGYTYDNAEKDAGDRIRNSYDKGDKNFNGICDDGEVWIGQKVYTENWMSIYTLNNPADDSDDSAYIALEHAINQHLDPKMHITIDPNTNKITMANGYKDPWKTQYHGVYDTNAINDGLDRGVILIYSNGANQKFGSEHVIENGILSVIVPDNNLNGQDDLVTATYYTFANGFGEVKTKTEFDTVADTTIKIINVLDTSMWQVGFVTNAGVLYTNVDTLVYSKRIPVRPGETYTLWSGTASLWSNDFRFVTAYDADGNVLKDSGINGGCHTYQVPAGVDTIVVSMSASQAPYSIPL